MGLFAVYRFIYIDTFADVSNNEDVESNLIYSMETKKMIATISVDDLAKWIYNAYKQCWTREACYALAEYYDKACNAQWEATGEELRVNGHTIKILWSHYDTLGELAKENGMTEDECRDFLATKADVFYYRPYGKFEDSVFFCQSREG